MTPQTLENEFSGSLDHKVEKLIFFATRHAMTVQGALETAADLRTRVQALEDDRNRRDVNDARAQEQMKSVLSEITYVKETMKGIRGILNKALWIIAGAVLLAAANWVLGGGFAKL